MAATAVIEMVNVGQGAATVLVSEGSAMVVDCARWAPVSKSLEDQAPEGSLDLLVLTHRDLDHINGAFQLMQRHHPASVVVNRSYALDPDGKVNPRVKTVLRSIFGWLEENPGRQREIVESDEGVIGALTWRCLWPTQAAINSGTIGDLSVNDSSVVLLVMIAGFSVLLTGDISSPRLRDIAVALGKVSVLQFSHHGAFHSDIRATLTALSPDWCIASAGRGNPYGHPHMDTIEAAVESESCVACTQVSIQCDKAAAAKEPCAGWVRFTVDATGDVEVTTEAGDHAARVDGLATPLCRPAGEADDL